MSEQFQNGRADITGTPIQLGDFLPERRQVTLNGQTYTAWITTNRRYPRRIMARLDQAARVYNRVIQPLLQTMEQPEIDLLAPEKVQAMDAQPEAWENYVNECVMLLVPGVLESDIELVELSVLEGLLRDLGYFRDTDASVPVEPEGDTKTNDPLTGAISADASPTSTRGTRPKRN